MVPVPLPLFLDRVLMVLRSVKLTPVQTQMSLRCTLASRWPKALCTVNLPDGRLWVQMRLGRSLKAPGIPGVVIGKDVLVEVVGDAASGVSAVW